MITINSVMLLSLDIYIPSSSQHQVNLLDECHRKWFDSVKLMARCYHQLCEV